MRESAKAALGGIIAALSISIMLLTYISPFLVYTAPVFAGILLIVIVTEIGYKWAFGTYTAISLLAIFLIADKEAAVFFIMLFGYYPILRTFILQRLKNRAVFFILKLLIFNFALAASISLCNFVFHIDYSEFTEKGRVYVAVFWVLMNIVLFLYDYLIGKSMTLYRKKIQKRIRQLFK